MKRKIQYFKTLIKGVETKADGSVRIEGYASTSDTDRYHDRVLPTAFADTMEQFMKNPVMLLQHDFNKLIGSFDEYSIESKGLKVAGDVKYDIDGVKEKIRNGDLGAFSIGFIVEAYEVRDKNGNLVATHEGVCPGFDYDDMWQDGNLRVITKLDLIEVSVVTTPANPNALFTLSQSVKSFFAEEKKSAYALIAKGDGCEPTDAPEAPAAEPAPAAPEGKEGEPPEAPAEQEPETEKEAPGGENPPTPETPEDVPAPDKSEPVEAGEKPEEPAPAAPSEEEKALAKKVAELESALAAATEKNAQLERAKTEAEAKAAEYERLAGTPREAVTKSVGTNSVTDDFVLASIGYGRR